MKFLGNAKIKKSKFSLHIHFKPYLVDLSYSLKIILMRLKESSFFIFLKDTKQLLMQLFETYALKSLC